MTQDQMMRLYATHEMSKFRFRNDLEAFVASLRGNEPQVLCALLSKWRCNRMSQTITSAAEWTEVTVGIDHIIVGHINDDVNPLLQQHGFRLSGIADDAKIREHPEFKDQGKVDFDQFIAVRQGEEFRLRDGNHRAIRLALDGWKEFKLIVPR
jgi:hypothetical protein